jgi:hypothetical protein
MVVPTRNICMDRRSILLSSFAVHRCCCYLYMVLVIAIAAATVVVAAAGAEQKQVDHSKNYHDEIVQHMDLFQYAPDAFVSGPTQFPRPTEYGITTRKRQMTTDASSSSSSEVVEPYLQPVYGAHRPDQDAVVAFAAEYPLSSYISFIESLRATGFAGDVVLAISPLDMRKEDVWEYLTEPNNHIVLYAPVLTCFNAEQEVVESAKGGSRVCICDDLYARRRHRTEEEEDGTTTTTTAWEPLPDPRPPRTVQTLRYEIYWLMCLAIAPQSWILLVDARDTYFQSQPFNSVPRNTDPTQQSGLLYMFGENVDATRLGQSKANSRWLQAAYGDYVTQVLKDKPTICSGATMGEQMALETYIRAMVAESDHTGTVLAGADQGFHNFLYYSYKFQYTTTIHSIVVFDQGQGIVNNMGALRTKPLDQWGNGHIVETITDPNERNPKKKNSYRVLNWDGSLSPVVHQFDRHQQLSDYFYTRKGWYFMGLWEERKKNLPTAIE